MSQAHRELGNKWSEIAKRLPGRPDNHVKNHWYSFMRRNVRRINKEVGKAVDGPIYLKDGLEAAALGLVSIEGPVLKQGGVNSSGGSNLRIKGEEEYTHRGGGMSSHHAALNESFASALMRGKFTEEEMTERKKQQKEEQKLMKKRAKLEAKVFLKSFMDFLFK